MNETIKYGFSSDFIWGVAASTAQDLQGQYPAIQRDDQKQRL